MLRSMTAYARREADFEWGKMSCELRSVNHRYLDVSIRMPEEIRALETAVRTRIGEALKRGKIECNLRVNTQGSAGSLEIDWNAADQLIAALRQVAERVGEAARPDAADILRWPGVMQTAGINPDRVGKDVLDTLAATLGDFVESREREGATIRDFMLERLQAMPGHIEQARANIPGVLNAQREKLRSRLQDLQNSVDQDRVEQEIVLMAQKIDIAEELDRLDTHIAEVRRIVMHEEPAGRRLDFMMQELNREANTLASKSVTADNTQASVELKVIIEQMREQVQNIE